MQCVLVGIQGLVDALEEHLLHGLPEDTTVDTVNAVPPKDEAPMAVWKGGGLLGMLDSRYRIWFDLFRTSRYCAECCKCR